MTGAVYFTAIELGKAAVINHRLRLYVYSSPEVVTERVTSTEVTFSGNRYSQLENLPQQIARTHDISGAGCSLSSTITALSYHFRFTHAKIYRKRIFNVPSHT